jgi:hypothetical protein
MCLSLRGIVSMKFKIYRLNVKEGVHRCKVPGLYLFYMYVPVIYLNSFVHYLGVCVVPYEYRYHTQHSSVLTCVYTPKYMYQDSDTKTRDKMYVQNTIPQECSSHEPTVHEVFEHWALNFESGHVCTTQVFRSAIGTYGCEHTTLVH